MGRPAINARTPYAYYYLPVGTGHRFAQCRLRYWAAFDGTTVYSETSIGSDRAACLQLIDAQTRSR